MTVNDKVSKYVEEITDILRDIELEKPIKGNALRFTVDDSDDSLGKKIRRAVSMKIPVILIVGEKDMEGKEVSVRLRDKEEKIGLSDLKKYIEGLDK